MRNLLLALMLCALAACEITCDDIDESSQATSVQAPPSLTELAQPVEEMEVRAERPRPQPVREPEPVAERDPEPLPLAEEVTERPHIDPSKIMPQGVGRRIELLGSPILRERLDLNVPLGADPEAL